MSSRMTRIIANFGYMETPDVTRSLYQARWHGFDIDVEHVSFFLGRRNIISDPRRGLPGWQDKIYIALARSAVAATDFYRIPRSQVVELGIQMSV
jgi:KUP system potassium uptake protein